jgi:hypothetical protein
VSYSSSLPLVMGKCVHGLRVCSRCVIVSDAAKRISDTINLHITFNHAWEIHSKWMAFRLADGTSDGVIYDSFTDATSHQPYPERCAYMCFRQVMGGANPRDAQLWLEMERNAADARLALHEDKAPRLIVPVKYHDYRTGRVRG